MDVQLAFGVSVLMSFIAFGVVARMYIWPALQRMERDSALVPLIVPHLFRFIGLSFLVPGVVSPSLPYAFAAPAAYGDAIAAVLAMIALFGLRQRTAWSIAAVWIFNVWGTADLLFAVYEGQFGQRIDAGWLGGSFYIPTLVVPPLLILHAMIFVLLLRNRAAAR